jgi:hypothetical protein
VATERPIRVNAAPTHGNHAAPAPSVSIFAWRAPGGNSNAGAAATGTAIIVMVVQAATIIRAGIVPTNMDGDGAATTTTPRWVLTVPFTVRLFLFWVGGAPYYYADDVWPLACQDAALSRWLHRLMNTSCRSGPGAGGGCTARIGKRNNANTPTPAVNFKPRQRRCKHQSESTCAIPKWPDRRPKHLDRGIRCERWGRRTGLTRPVRRENMQRRKLSIRLAALRRGYTVK